MKKYMILVTILTLSIVSSAGLLAPRMLYAHENWYNRDYYPQYRHNNPVVRREYNSTQGFAPDGTYHEEDTVVDKHSSYYSRGRNQAITQPRTTVRSWSNGPGRETTREKTTWIGADRRPHSTTITRDTTEDRWGNTYTDTHVDLKRIKP